MANNNPLTNRLAFLPDFRHRIKRMAEQHEVDIGKLILTCSNFAFSKEDFNQDDQEKIGTELNSWLQEVSSALSKTLLAGKPMSGEPSDDDVLVFLKMAMVGI